MKPCVDHYAAVRRMLWPSNPSALQPEALANCKQHFGYTVVVSRVIATVKYGQAPCWKPHLEHSKQSDNVGVLQLGVDTDFPLDQVHMEHIQSALPVLLQHNRPPRELA